MGTGLCFKEGSTDEKAARNVGLVHRMITRENCNAQLQAKKYKSGQYITCKFIPEHSHPLSSPHKSFMLWSHRRVTDAKKKLMQTFDAVNI